MLNSMTYSLPEDLENAVQLELFKWKKEDVIARIWRKDASVWTNADEAKWLGWLDSVEAELSKTEEYEAFKGDVKKFKSFVLLGMGGSSLCPEVLSKTFEKTHFHILDSTVPAQIKTIEDKVDLAETLFIVASKSGSTLEPNCFKQYFYERVAETVGAENAGKHFAAITDPDSKMQAVAEAGNFRKIFFGNPEIGGRFSALSPFGMAAGAAMGLDTEDFLKRAAEMVEACREENPSGNPGAMLGIILGTAHKNGRDKLTIYASPEIYDAGAWLEQLIAESTGKRGVSIIPIDREPILAPENYGDDSTFVYLKTEGAENAAFENALAELAANAQPVVRISLAEKANLGQEFFRWEFATAAAGAIMEINPFDQPDVESAKIETRKLTEEYERTGELPIESPFFEADGIELYAGEDYAEELSDAIDEKTIANYLEAHLLNLEENDYFALLGFIEMNAETEELLQKIRVKVLEREQVATCLGFGPRFLHSTGQAYKGGANNGVFLQITADDAFDLDVPGQKYTFGTVKAAQARGDFQVLIDRGRRALRVHLATNVKDGLKKLLNQI